ncbi:HEAT repeat domain-containing protein [soil metagenome]
MSTSDSALRTALGDPSASARLQAALSAGTHPDPSFVDALVERCATEPDFYVRDMLTWALTRHPAAATVPRLLEEVRTGEGQARSQALHSLSKIRDPRGWEAITGEVLHDPDDEVARTAWRAAVVLAPDDDRPALARVLVSQLGRGGRDVQLSLSRALVELGAAAADELAAARENGSPDARAHALATERLILDPDEAFDTAVFEARRTVALRDMPPPPPPPGE